MSDPAPLTIEDHPHAHDRFCGHPVIPHDDHLDFLHDGEIHHVMGGALAATAESADLHVVHTGHMHVHGPACGHPSVLHDDHLDYLHGDHRHAAHASHYDEH
jgi:hypothetical protein